ncbi:hypothetical protein EIP86_001293 [Pleurotus ostreatoroseus]|nr:hypothetical protein EIP86_001293 [Pleurotus ostreatoroseus]
MFAFARQPRMAKKSAKRLPALAPPFIRPSPAKLAAPQSLLPTLTFHSFVHPHSFVMKLSVAFVSLVVAAGAAQAAFPHAARDLSDVHARHAHLNRRHDFAAPVKVKRSDAASTTKAPATTSSQAAAPAQETTTKKTKTSSSAAAAKTASSSSSSSGNILTVSFPQCANITPTAGPNGAEYFLNCGIDNGGWNPPPVTMGDLITVELGDALKDPNSPFKACSSYLSLFEQYGGQFGIPAIYLASIAMQESSCDPNKTGGAGEQGLMQITKDKCGNAPDGNCKEPWYNIMTGAQFFSSLLSSNNGNVLLATGMYNGWKKGLTIGEATAAANTDCCTCQNNLDYLTQTLNGWLQNRDPSASPRIGQYFNLDQCNR